MKTLALVIPFVFVLGCGPKSKPPEGGSGGGMTGGGSDVTGSGSSTAGGGGGSDVECEKKACGPKLGMPNHKCPDGTIAGPTDRCLRHADGKCGWEVIQCPGGGGGGGGSTAAACKPTGCSSTICADTDMISTCIYLAEYDCYKTATCERQSNGQCGWTQTDALTSCIASKRRK